MTSTKETCDVCDYRCSAEYFVTADRKLAGRRRARQHLPRGHALTEPTEAAAPAAPPLNREAPLPSPERLQELLFDASRLGRSDVIPALVQAGADIEGQDDRGYTPLILASYNGQAEATRLLLDLGARPDGRTGASESSALMGVAFKGHLAIAKLLLEAGADPNYKNGAGQTPLMMAALFGQDAVVDTLLDAGADHECRDAAGNSAASLAEQQGNRALAARLG